MIYKGYSANDSKSGRPFGPSETSLNKLSREKQRYFSLNQSISKPAQLQSLASFQKAQYCEFRMYTSFAWASSLCLFLYCCSFVTPALYSLVCCPSYPCRAAHGLSAVLPTFNFNLFYESISSLPRNIISWY